MTAYTVKRRYALTQVEVEAADSIEAVNKARAAFVTEARTGELLIVRPLDPADAVLDGRSGQRYEFTEADRISETERMGL